MRRIDMLHGGLLPRRLVILTWLAAAAMTAGCGVASSPSVAPSPPGSSSPPASSSPTAPVSTPLPTPAPPALGDVEGIVDPTNLGWPREVRTADGTLTILSQPFRIHTLSLGLDEVTLSLVPPERVVAVGSFTKDPAYSNVASLAEGAATVGRDAEQIIAVKPDIVIASPFANADLLKALDAAGLTVARTELRNDTLGRIHDTLLLGYLYGEEERALSLAAEIAGRHDALVERTTALAAGGRPRVLSIARFTDSINAAGADSTEDSIIEMAGGEDAARSAFDGHETIDLEGIISLRPDVIIIPQSAEEAEAFRKDLLADPALATVPAIASGRVYAVSPRLFQTLSSWNILGAEDLARILWPDDLADLESPPFSLPSPGG